MLKEKMLWMKDSGNIGDEIRQCRDEAGRLRRFFPGRRKLPLWKTGRKRKTGQGASVGNGELPC